MTDFEERKSEFLRGAYRGRGNGKFRDLESLVTPGDPHIPPEGDVYVRNNRKHYGPLLLVCVAVMATVIYINIWNDLIVLLFVMIAAGLIYFLVKYFDQSVKLYLCKTGIAPGPGHPFTEWRNVLDILVYNNTDEAERPVLVLLIYNRETAGFEEVEWPMPVFNNYLLYRRLWHFWQNANSSHPPQQRHG